jgi:hypothetical protein
MFPSIYHSSAGRNFWGQDERKRRGEERRGDRWRRKMPWDDAVQIPRREE